VVRCLVAELEAKKATLHHDWRGTNVGLLAYLYMEQLDKHKEQALVVLSLSTATLIACFGIALAVL
jgi:hypothetical protein